MTVLGKITISATLVLLIILPAFSAGIQDQEYQDSYDQAWHDYNSGKHKKAIQLFREMQVKYPGDSRLYLTLGTIYLELGDYDKAKDELRNALLNDPTFEEEIWANVRLGNVLLKDGALEAAGRHFRLAAVKGAEPKALIETARGLHRVEIQEFLEERFKSGRFLIHYFPFGVIKEDDLEWLAARLEWSFQQCNQLLKVKREFPIEVYLYPNVQAFINSFRGGADTVYPKYNEIHEILDKDYDYFEAISPLLVYWLQVEMNRHGASDFINFAIPHLVRGSVLGLDLHTYVYALVDSEMFVDLKLLRHPTFYPMVDRAISGPEIASFIDYLIEEHRNIDIRQFLTQPNLEALYGLDVITAQEKWLAWLEGRQSLAKVDEEEIRSILSYVREFDLPGYVPEEAMERLKKGLEQIGAGNKKEGKEEIQEVIKDYPNFGLAYYSLGRFEFEGGNYDDAREHFEKAIGMLTPRGASWGWSHYNLGHISEVEEDYVSAKMHYEKALESDVPNEIRVVAAEKVNRLLKVADIAPTPGGKYETGDFREAVTLFSFIDLGLLNNRLGEMVELFATELNEGSHTQFVSTYNAMFAPFSTPIVMHQVSAVESIGDFVKAKVILKLEVPESEHSSITEFEEYLKLRRGIIRYFLLLRAYGGLKIVEFVDAPSIAGRAKVIEEGGTIIPYGEED